MLTRFLTATAMAALIGLLATTSHAQPPGGGPGPGGPGPARPGPGGPGGPGVPFGPGGAADLLRNPQIAKELDLVDEQTEQLSKLSESTGARFRQAFERLRNLDENQRREEMRKLFDSIREDTEKQVSDILLPHQQQRLAQIQRQMRMRGGVERGLMEGDLASELGITDQQKEALGKKAEEARKTLEEKIAKAREEAQQEILSVLTPAQRKRYEELIGKPFEFRFDRGPGRPPGDRGPGAQRADRGPGAPGPPPGGGNRGGEDPRQPTPPGR